MRRALATSQPNTNKKCKKLKLYAAAAVVVDSAYSFNLRRTSMEPNLAIGVPRNQNPHLMQMQQQLAAQQMNARVHQEGAARVNGAFQDFAEEMRNNYAAMVERCRLLEER